MLNRTIKIFLSISLFLGSHVLLSAQSTDSIAHNTFIVISKKDLNLKVYRAQNGDTTLLQKFDVCLGKYRGDKTMHKDMCTPESSMSQPFEIISIENSSDWHHDFGDGRGRILAYGNWFLRLRTGHHGIGIHGSTNNENTVPGRKSEGCIRLHDSDIIVLKEKYAYIGMPVIIKRENQDLFSFEKNI